MFGYVMVKAVHSPKKASEGRILQHADSVDCSSGGWGVNLRVDRRVPFTI